MFLTTYQNRYGEILQHVTNEQQGIGTAIYLDLPFHNNVRFEVIDSTRIKEETECTTI